MRKQVTVSASVLRLIIDRGCQISPPVFPLFLFPIIYQTTLKNTKNTEKCCQISPPVFPLTTHLSFNDYFSDNTKKYKKY